MHRRPRNSSSAAAIGPTHSVVTLCVATIIALFSVAFVGVAFSTDNWTHVSVDRRHIAEKSAEFGIGDDTFETDFRYFDRVQGIFRVCFSHEEKPRLDSLYLNPIEEWCFNQDYYVKLLEHGLLPKRVTRNGEIWFHLARTAIAGFILYFMWTGIASVTGFLGCWRSSGDHLISTALLLLVASLCGAAGMGLWHWAKFYEMEKVLDASLSFYQTWPEHLRENTHFSIGWSYIMCWVGVSLTLVSSILFSISAMCMRHEHREIEHVEMMAKMQLTYPSLANTIMRQPMHGVPAPYHGVAADQLSLNGYYPGGYSVQYEDCRAINYKNVVKELEDAKL